MKTTTTVLLLCALAAILLSCTDNTETSSLGVGSGESALRAQLITRGLPSLPQGKDPSVLMSFTQIGAAAIYRHSSATEVATALHLESATGGISWGIWGLPYGSEATECLVDFTGLAGAEAYFAISDYASGTWAIDGSVPGPQATLTLNDPRYASPSDIVYIAVIAYDGATIDVDQLSLIADINPVRMPIDNSGGYTSMAIVDGFPAISFYDDVDHNLCFVRASDVFGASWGSVQILDSAGDTGQWTSLKVVDGNPAIAYFDFTAKRLRYIRSTDSTGGSWGLPMTVDNSGQCGEYASLDVVAGLPAISYYHSDAPELRFVIGSDSTGSSWDLPVSPDSDGNTGQETCLEVVNGFPAIAYRKGAAGEVRYVRASDANGSAWEAPKILQSGNNSGYSNSLVVVNGKPSIACYDLTDSFLLYFRAMDSLGDSWSTPGILDGLEFDAGSYCSMAVIGSVPCISYHHGLQGELRYVQAVDADGSGWLEPLILDESSVIIGKYTSLINLYGMPAISYWDQTNGKLCYAWGL